MTNKFSFTGKVQIALPCGAASPCMLDWVNPSNSPSGRNSDARLCPSSTPKSIDRGSTSKSNSSHTKEDRIQGQT